MTNSTLFATARKNHLPRFNQRQAGHAASSMLDVQQRRLQAAQKEAERLRTMTSELQRIVTVLEANLEAELERSEIRDPSHYAFPMSARALIARRENLKATIASLLDRLATVESAGRSLEPA